MTLIRSIRIPQNNPNDPHKTRAGWLCRCDCGRFVQRTTRNIRENSNCGAILHQQKYEHSDGNGGPYHTIYARWQLMLRRCENPNDPAYEHYGGRGIKVCDEWHDYNVFKQWYLNQGFDAFGNDKRTTDRIDVNSDYCPQNCRLADISVQANNKRNTKYVEHAGKKYSARDVVNIYPSLSFNTVRRRIYQDMSWEDVIRPAKKVLPIRATNGSNTMIFDNKSQAGRTLNIDSSYIGKCMRAGKPAKGWSFEYVENENIGPKISSWKVILPTKNSAVLAK